MFDGIAQFIQHHADFGHIRLEAAFVQVLLQGGFQLVFLGQDLCFQSFQGAAPHFHR